MKEKRDISKPTARKMQFVMKRARRRSEANRDPLTLARKYGRHKVHLWDLQLSHAPPRPDGHNLLCYREHTLHFHSSTHDEPRVLTNGHLGTPQKMGTFADKDVCRVWDVA